MGHDLATLTSLCQIRDINQLQLSKLLTTQILFHHHDSVCVCVCVNCLVMSYSLQPHRLQPREAPLSMGFSRLEHWSGLPFPSPKGTIEGKKVKLLSRVWLFETPWTVAYQSPPSMEFSRQEYWSGLPFPSPRHKSKGLQSGRWVLGICMPGIS